MGSIVWQLNDCWPVTSWAAVDGDWRAKPLLYAIAGGAHRPAAYIQPATRRTASTGLVVAAVNDTPDEWAGTMQFIRLGFDGAARASEAL